MRPRPALARLRRMRFPSLILLLGLALTAQAQTDEFGVRYWYSDSTTTRSHNAQPLVPSLGNPTSVLTYEDLRAHALELHGRKRFGGSWFVKGNAGIGTIKNKASFDDEDFFAGQVKFSDSTSVVNGDKLAYFTIDVGRDLWRFRNGSAGLFIGYQYWSETLDAFGAAFTVGNVPRIPDSVAVISNEVTWNSLRAGITATTHLSAATRFTVDAAFVPFAHGRDEDSHLLRQNPNDLGPAPNIHIQGDGYGFQLDLELRHAVQRDWEIGAGVRYWWLRATDGTRNAAGTSVPLVELESERFGITLSLTRRW